MIDQRRLSVWLMLVGFAISLATVAVAWGVAFWLLAILVGIVGGLHWAYSCRRCSNPDCPLNARGACFLFGRSCGVESAACMSERALCIDAIWALLPMAAVVLLAVYMAWMAAPEAAVASLVFLAVGIVLYSGAVCTSCVNRCPLNRNPARAVNGPGRTSDSGSGPRPDGEPSGNGKRRRHTE